MPEHLSGLDAGCGATTVYGRSQRRRLTERRLGQIAGPTCRLGGSLDERPASKTSSRAPPGPRVLTRLLTGTSYNTKPAESAALSHPIGCVDTRKSSGIPRFSEHPDVHITNCWIMGYAHRQQETSGDTAETMPAERYPSPAFAFSWIDREATWRPEAATAWVAQWITCS